MIVSLSAPNLVQPYPAHIEDLAAVGVLGVLVHICSSWCLNKNIASGIANAALPSSLERVDVPIPTLPRL